VLNAINGILEFAKKTKATIKLHSLASLKTSPFVKRFIWKLLNTRLAKISCEVGQQINPCEKRFKWS